MTKTDAINKFLTGEEKHNALDFIEFLTANQITTQPNSNNIRDFYYQNKTICCVTVKGAENIANPWMIWLSDAELDAMALNNTADESLKQFAWAHMNTCAHFSSNGESCGCDKSPGRSATVFGKQFDNICYATLSFENPGAEDLVYIKQLVSLLKDWIDKK